MGFEYERVSADNHLVYWKEGLSRPVIVPKYKTISKKIIANIIKTGRINREEYIRILTRPLH